MKKCVHKGYTATKYTFFQMQFSDDDFKVGGVQVSTSFYVKVPRLQFVVYSCPFSFKTWKKEDSRHETKKINRLQYQKSRLDMTFYVVCLWICDTKLSLFLPCLN